MLVFSTASLAGEQSNAMSYNMAMKAMEAAEAYARQQDWNVTVLVTDQNAEPVMLHRMDGAPVRSIGYANSKALVVTQTSLTSGDYATKLKAGEIEEVEGGVTYKGGVPVFLDGKLLGAVTVSGVKDYQDEEVAIAGTRAIASYLVKNR